MSYKIAIVSSEFNKEITDNLIAGAKDAYSKALNFIDVDKQIDIFMN